MVVVFRIVDPRIPVYNAGMEHVGFSPTRQTLLATRGRERGRWDKGAGGGGQGVVACREATPY